MSITKKFREMGIEEDEIEMMMDDLKIQSFVINRDILTFVLCNTARINKRSIRQRKLNKFSNIINGFHFFITES